MPSCRLRRVRFTLVELLVVITIITILLALLLPGLQRARHSARTIYCMSSLRQVHLALTLYAEDYKGHFPIYYQAGYFGSGGGLNNMTWMYLLSGRHEPQGVSGYVPDRQSFYCPELETHDTMRGDLRMNTRMGDWYNTRKTHHPSKLYLAGDGEYGSRHFGWFHYEFRHNADKNINIIFHDGHASGHEIEPVVGSWSARDPWKN